MPITLLFLLSPLLISCSSGSGSSVGGDRAEVDTQDQTPQLVKAGKLIATGRQREGIEVLERLLPRSPRPASIHERIAAAWFDIGEVNVALRHADSALDLGRPTVERYILRGRIRDALWDDNGAMEDFSRALELDPENLEGLWYGADILSRSSPEEGVGLYRRILELRPGDITALDRLRVLYVDLHEYRQAALLAEITDSLAPDATDATVDLPTLWLQADEVERSIDRFNRLIATWPADRLESNILPGVLENYLRLIEGKHDTAIQRFADPVVSYVGQRGRINTFSGELVALTAIIAYRSNRPLSGDTLAAMAIGRKSIPPEMMALVGVAALEGGSPGTAITIFERFEREREYDPVLLTLLGKAYLAEGRLEEGEKVFGESLELDSLRGEAWVGIGRIHGLRGEIPKAISSFERGIQLAPYDPDIVTQYGWFLALSGHHQERGYELVRSLAEEELDNPELLEVYALLCFETGKLQLAESLLQTVNLEYGLSPFGLGTWGDLYVRLGNPEMGVRLWNEAVEKLGDPTWFRGPRPEASVWGERLRRELLEKINSYGSAP